MRILAVVFAVEAGELSVGAIAERAGVAQATASREITRLARHGIVVTRSLGRNTLVSANWELPWARELRSILVQTVGVLGLLGDALSPIPSVEEAYVFGSWAARYRGDAGPPPRDIDVVVIGDAPLRDVHRAARDVERHLTIDVNPVVLDQPRWNARKPEPLIAEIRDRPLVPIPLHRP